MIDLNPESLVRWITPVGLAVLAVIAGSVVRRRVWRALDSDLRRELGGPARVFPWLAGIVILIQLSPAELHRLAIARYGLRLTLLVYSIWVLDRVLAFGLGSPKVLTKIDPPTRSILGILGRGALVSLLLLMSLETLGIPITPVLASLGVGSFAVAFALQDTLQNFFAGLYIHFDRPIQVGDTVQLESGAEGTVSKIGWRSTHILLGNGNMLVTPNSKLSGAMLTNCDLPSRETLLSVVVPVDVRNDVVHVERIVTEVARQVQSSTPGIVQGRESIVRFRGITDQGMLQVQISLVVSHSNDLPRVRHELLKALLARFHRDEIGMLPQVSRT